MIEHIARTNAVNPFQRALTAGLATAALLAGMTAVAAADLRRSPVEFDHAATVGAAQDGYGSPIFAIPRGFVRSPGYSPGPYDPTGPRLGVDRPVD